MPRRLGPYAPLSATYASDDAIIEAGEAAELLFCRALAFCSTSNSDGYITESQLVRYVGVGMRDAKKRAARLVEVGLWERMDGGYNVRSWLKWNKSTEELGQERKKDRDRKANRNPDPIPDGIRAESERNPDGVQKDTSPESSHAGARTGAQTPAPPNHSTPRHSTPKSPTGADAPQLRAVEDEPDGPDLRPVVAAYVDGAREAGRSDPSARLKGKVGRDASRLAKSVSVDRLAAAARQMGAKGWDDLDRELQRLEPVGPVLTETQQRYKGGLS